MPIYEYRCGACGRRSSRLWTRVPEAAQERALACPACGSGRLARVFSRFSTPKGPGRRAGALLDEAASGGLPEDDPRALARLLRRASEESGEQLEGGDADLIERMEAGEMPPDDAGDGGEAGGDDGP